MKENLKTKTIADDFFKKVLKEIKGVKPIAFKCPSYYSIKKDSIVSFNPDDFDPLQIYFENKKVLVLSGYDYGKMYAAYLDIDKYEKQDFPKFYDIFNSYHEKYNKFHMLKSRTKFKFEYTEIVDIQTRGYNKAYEIYEEGILVKKPSGEDLFDQIAITFANGKKVYLDLTELPYGDLYITVEGIEINYTEILSDEKNEIIENIVEICNKKKINTKILGELLYKIDPNIYLDRRRRPLAFECMIDQTVENAIIIYENFSDSVCYRIDKIAQYCLEYFFDARIKGDPYKFADFIVNKKLKNRVDEFSVDFEKIAWVWENKLKKMLNSKKEYSKEYTDSIEAAINLFKVQRNYKRR